MVKKSKSPSKSKKRKKEVAQEEEEEVDIDGVAEPRFHHATCERSRTVVEQHARFWGMPVYQLRRKTNRVFLKGMTNNRLLFIIKIKS